MERQRSSVSEALPVRVTLRGEAVVGLIADKVARTRGRRALMAASVSHHRHALLAIRAGDGPGAERLARRALYDYYAGYVPDSERETLRSLAGAGGGVGTGAGTGAGAGDG